MGGMFNMLTSISEQEWNMLEAKIKSVKGSWTWTVYSDK